MRIFSALALVCVAGCNSGEEAPTGDQIACAVDGASEYANVCYSERWQADGNMLLVIRHPDGGFRRFEILPEGRGIAVADGMEDARIELKGDVIEASVGDDRYRIPIKPGKGTAALPAAEKTEAVTNVSGEKAIDCAVDGSNRFSPACAVETVEIEGEATLLVRHPDGGFRRFGVDAESGKLGAADGADFANVSVADGVTQIEVNEDAYRIPQNLLSDAGR